MSNIQLFQRLLNPCPELEVHTIDAETRMQAEQYIAGQFSRSYGAKIKDFLPLLLSLRCNNSLSAVTGICPASDKHLFVEQYLEHSIDVELSKLSSQITQRSTIVEIGNLASHQRGATLLLFVLLAAVLHRANFKWLAFTATPHVQKTIGKMGFHLSPITEALPHHIEPSSLADWGSYYETKPWVVTGQLEDATRTIQNNQMLRGICALYKDRIDILANLIRNRADNNNVKYPFAA